MRMILMFPAILAYLFSGVMANTHLPADRRTVADGSANSVSASFEAIRLECINPTAHAQFGHAVALDGNYLVVGTCYEDQTTGEHGQAYVYHLAQGEWNPCAKLSPTTGSPGKFFGWAVSISGDRILVGTRGASAHLFVRSGDDWIEECQLGESDLEPEDQFGWSVSLDGNLAVIGSWAETAYVYRLSEGGWLREDVLRANDSDTFINFGVSVAVDQETILVGAPMDSAAGLWSGSAFIFKRDEGAWIQETRLTSSDGPAGQGFGKKVALSGNTAMVSAPDSENHAGTSYIFNRTADGWTEEARLETGCTKPCDIFGGSVSINGDCAAVGACGVTEGESWGAGAVYIFRRSLDQWQHVSTLTPPQRQKECFFGYTIALDAKRILVGAHCQDCPKSGEDSGTAYVFDSQSN